MLCEIARVRQRAGEPRRRWFADEAMDLTVWQAADGAVVAFQLAYDRPIAEHAVSWRRDGGLRHDAVDDGETVGVRHKRAPVLVPDGPVPAARLRTELLRRGRAIDGAVLRAVARRLPVRS